MKVAYICEPHVGGMFTFFTRIRPELARRDIDFRCVSPVSGKLFEGSAFRDMDGVDFLDVPEPLADATGMIMNHLVSKDYHVAMVLPGCYMVSSNLPRFLPRRVRCVARIPMITRGTYAPAQTVGLYLDRVVAVVDRIASDLKSHYGFPAWQVATIYNGIDPTGFSGHRSGDDINSPFRILYVGRLEELQKNVLILPAVLKHVLKATSRVELIIIGGGPDRDRLQLAFSKLGIEEHVKMLDAVPLEGIERHYAEADCFLMTSRYEGFPNAVLEAMASACVPVMSDIKQLSSVVVEQGVSGFIVPMDDARAYAEAIIKLAEDRTLRRRLGEEARHRVGSNFTLKRMGEQYEQLFREVVSSEDKRPEPIALSAYDIPAGLKPTWRTLVPKPIKRIARQWLEKFGRSA